MPACPAPTARRSPGRDWGRKQKFPTMKGYPAQVRTAAGGRWIRTSGSGQRSDYVGGRRLALHLGSMPAPIGSCGAGTGETGWLRLGGRRCGRRRGGSSEKVGRGVFCPARGQIPNGTAFCTTCLLPRADEVEAAKPSRCVAPATTIIAAKDVVGDASVAK